MEDKNSKIKEFANKHGLFDIAGDRHTVQIPATFERVNTSRRIDFFLCTEEVFINVLAYGMAPGRYDKILGDHRAQYVDINTNELLQLNSHDISSPSSRKLRSTDPKCTKTYIEKLLISFDKHNLTHRMENLLREIDGHDTLTPRQQAKYEKIDRDVHRLCTNAENNIRTVKSEKYMWSPELDTGVKTVQHWKARRNHISDHTKTKCLIGMAASIGLKAEITKTKAEIHLELKQAYKGLHRNQLKHQEKRI